MTAWNHHLQSRLRRYTFASYFINSLQAPRYHILHALGTFNRSENLCDLVILLCCHRILSHHTAIPIRREFSLFYVPVRKELLVRSHVRWINDIVEVVRGILPNVSSFCERRISQDGRKSCQRLGNKNQTGNGSLTLRYVLRSLFTTMLQRCIWDSQEEQDIVVTCAVLYSILERLIENRKWTYWIVIKQKPIDKDKDQLNPLRLSPILQLLKFRSPFLDNRVVDWYVHLCIQVIVTTELRQMLGLLLCEFKLPSEVRPVDSGIGSIPVLDIGKVGMVWDFIP